MNNCTIQNVENLIINIENINLNDDDNNNLKIINDVCLNKPDTPINIDISNIDNHLKGEIYMIKNKINNKTYIGQALKFVSKKKAKWGTNGRWKSHIREALSSEKDHCILLNQAIRKYGVDNFEITKLCDCLIEDMNEHEIYYIYKYNSLIPNGYNLNTGGSKGKDSDETKKKKSESRKGLQHSDQTKMNIRFGQKGVRRNKEDESLPDFICAQRRNGVICSYEINKFYTNTNLTEYIRKSYKNLDDAIKKLEELKKEYPDVWELYVNYKRNRNQNK
jgi:group I intron endonuclease